ncbi:MAG: c-type cytochrome [Candidatus Brocadiaceae bacterium]|nr:c-type cytochrome [Candidatus Brocadiaceae bacterium]
MNQEEKTSFEDTVIPGYEYDGITELDNPCPKWLMYIFYFTLIFSIFYLGYFIGRSTKPSEFQKTSLVEAQEILSQSQKKRPEMSTIEASALLQDMDALAQGESLYVAKCKACHGPEGEGLIGPNLTDNYWLHGRGKIIDIATIIRTGIEDKGMMPWEGKLPEEDILKIAAYIKSLSGTQPPNAKEPEGDLIEK